MTYTLLKFVHVLGAVLIGGGLISVWLSDSNYILGVWSRSKFRNIINAPIAL